MSFDTRSEILRLLVRCEKLSTVQIMMRLGVPADTEEALENLRSRGYLEKDGDCWSLKMGKNKDAP